MRTCNEITCNYTGNELYTCPNCEKRFCYQHQTIPDASWHKCKPTNDGIERDTFASRLTERSAELEAQREKAPILDRVIINGQIGLIQAIAHDYELAKAGLLT